MIYWCIKCCNLVMVIYIFINIKIYKLLDMCVVWNKCCGYIILY